MSTLKHFIQKYIKRQAFIDDFTKGIEPGINHRFAMKPTNESDKKNINLTEEDEFALREGWEEFVKEGQIIFDKIQPPKKLICLLEYINAGGILESGLSVVVKKKQGFIKYWEINPVNKAIVEINGNLETHDFTMVFIEELNIVL